MILITTAGKVGSDAARPHGRCLPLNLPLSLMFPGSQLAAVSGRMPSSASPRRSFSISRS